MILPRHIGLEVQWNITGYKKSILLHYQMTTAILLFMYWITWRMLLTQEALVRDFTGVFVYIENILVSIVFVCSA
jgi:hypothetical protein